MLIRLFMFVLFYSISCNELLGAGDPLSNSIEQIKSAASKTDSVRVYFVSRTGNYDFEKRQMKKNSSVRTYRKCGSNCAVYLERVIEHVRRSKLVNCQSGQQSVLIEITPQFSITYSFSGRMIKIGQNCFFSDTDIKSVVADTSFLFY